MAGDSSWTLCRTGFQFRHDFEPALLQGRYLPNDLGMARGEPATLLRRFGRISRRVGQLGLEALAFGAQLFQLALEPALLIPQRGEAVARLGIQAPLFLSGG